MSEINLNILIIDDEEKLLTTLNHILPQFHKDIQITTTKSGQQGLDYIERNGFNCILLDVVMPEITGVQVLKRIRELEKKYFIVIMTAYIEDPLMDEIKKLGYDGFLKKPFSIDELNNFLRKVDGRKK